MSGVMLCTRYVVSLICLSALYTVNARFLNIGLCTSDSVDDV